MNKYIISCIRFGQKAYVCHNNFSGSYSAGVLEFDTKEEAWAEAAKKASGICYNTLCY